jgi:hypothetical protein
MAVAIVAMVVGVGSGSADCQRAEAEAEGGSALLGQGLCRRGSRSGNGQCCNGSDCGIAD